MPEGRLIWTGFLKKSPQSPWTDLKNAITIKPFRIKGHHGARNFEISAFYVGPSGWLVIGGPGCTWERFHPVRQFCRAGKLTKSNGIIPKVKIAERNLRIPLVFFLSVCYQYKEITRDFLNMTPSTNGFLVIRALFWLIKTAWNNCFFFRFSEVIVELIQSSLSPI